MRMELCRYIKIRGKITDGYPLTITDEAIRLQLQGCACERVCRESAQRLLTGKRLSARRKRSRAAMWTVIDSVEVE